MKDNKILDLCEAHHIECGGKAEMLARMLQMGIPVPHGFVLSPVVFFEHAHKNTDLDKQLKDEIKKRITSMVSQVIVRSSAVGEDSSLSSFAGQLTSIVCENHFDSVWAAIQTCWASYFSEHVEIYQRNSQVKLNGMAVIVQNFVEADFAGVYFSTSPTNSNQIYLEYCEGDCAKLVDGMTTPNAISLNKENVQMIQHHVDLWQSLPTIIVEQLTAVAKTLQQQLLSEIDMEWCYQQNLGLQIVQVRPITTKCTFEETSEEIVWSSANIAENYPEPASPLLFSVAKLAYQYYFLNLGKSFGLSAKRLKKGEKYLANLIGSYNGCLYYNLSNIYHCLGLAPAGGYIQSYWCTFLGMDESSFTLHQDRKVFAKDIYDFIKMFFSGIWAILHLKKGLAKFSNEAQIFYEHTKSAKNQQDFCDLLAEFRKIRTVEWQNAAIADAAAMFGIGFLKSILYRYLSNAEQMMPRLLEGIPQLESKKPIFALWKLEQLIRQSEVLFRCFKNNSPDKIWLELQREEHQAIFKEILTYLDQWGYRNSGELLLTKKSFCEDPLQLIHLLKMRLCHSTIDPVEFDRQQIEKRKMTLQKLKKEMKWWQWYICYFAIQLTTRGIFFREISRIKQAQIYYSLRKTALLCGTYLKKNGILTNVEDVFYLYFEELEAILNASYQFPQTILSMVEVRKKHFDGIDKLDYPLNVKLKHHEWLQSKQNSQKTNFSSSDKFLTGLGVSEGVVEGAACVVHSLDQIAALKANSILVTRYTDPGWTLYFSQIKGLVLEHGGLLCHGAIVAREFGIPTVTSVKNATQLIANGELVKIDGKEGYVRIV